MQSAGRVLPRRRLPSLFATALLLSAAVTAFPTPEAARAQTCGSNLTEVAAPAAVADSLNMLVSVDASGASDAWSVGHSANVFRTTAERWDGSSWQLTDSPSVGSDDTGLNGIAMVSPGDVWAVGYRTIDFNRFATVAQHWDGTSWTVVPTLNPGRDSNVLIGVAAISSTDVWAVGFSLTGSKYSALIKHWNGSSWSAVSAPSVGTGSNVLIGVAAASSTDVWAVGYAVNGFKYQTLIEHWDGTGWSAFPNPNPIGNHAVLTAVDASSAGAWAVGYSGWGSTYRTLAERWDGSAWTIVPTVDPSTDFSVLRGVAIDPGGGAWAVGGTAGANGNFNPLAEHWDGSTWTVSPTPGLAPGGLLGVEAGPDPGSVIAVGYHHLSPLILSTCSTRAVSGTSAAGLGADRTERVRAASTGDVEPADTTNRPSSRASTPLRAAAPAAATPTAVEESAQAGISEVTESWDAQVTDFNNDDWPDFFLGRHGGVGRLYLNDQGHFTEIDSGTFVTRDRHGCAWLDWSRDGLADLVCVVGGDKGYGVKSNELWVQRPDHTFVNEGSIRGLADPFGRGREVVPLDANGDGLTDLFVTNLNTRPDGLPTPDRLFLNTGGGFRLALFYGVDNEIGSVCAATADFNGDGWQDLLTCPRLTGLRLYRNEAGQRFTDVSSQMGVVGDRDVKDALFSDLNGDGLPDLVEVTPSRLLVRIQQAGVFVLRFTYPLHSGAWAAAGDVNGDGRPDLYISETTTSANSPDVMLLNDGTGTQFSSVPIPQTSDGLGGHVSAIDYNRNGAADFIVLNGFNTPGPVQLISFYP